MLDLFSIYFYTSVTVSESVERAEFLESSTKTYGVPLLMSDAFYNLLDSSNRNRCRKVDQLIMLREDEDEGLDELLDNGEKMLLVRVWLLGIYL